MSNIREFLGDKFDEHRANGAVSNFAGQLIGEMDRDELLALVGWLADDSRRQRESHLRSLRVMSALHEPTA